MVAVMGRFYGPMALYYVLMLLSQILIGVGFSRTGEMTVAFASYGIVFTAAGFFSAIAYSVRNLVLVLGTDASRLRAVARLTTAVAAVVVIGQGLVSFTPLGPWVYENIFHVSGDVLRQSLTASTVLPVMVAADALRGLLHGRLVVLRRPGVMVTGMVLRNVALAGWLLLALALKLELGALVGTAGMTLAISVEAGVALWAVLREGPMTPGPKPEVVLSFRQTLGQFLPLAGTAVLAAVVPTVVTATIARTPHAATSLAAYQIAVGGGGVIFTLILPISDIVVVFAREGGHGSSVLRFCAAIGGVVALLLLLLGLRPVGGPLLKMLYGATDSLASMALSTIRAYAIHAMVETGRLYLFGMAVRRANTRAALVAKAFGVAGALVAAAVLPRSGACTGIWVLVTTASTEILILACALGDGGSRWTVPPWKWLKGRHRSFSQSTLSEIEGRHRYK